LKKVFSLLFILVVILSCGKKKSPTGGKDDKIKPKIILIDPQEFSDINLDKTIKVTFSKHIDKKSFQNGLYIYPPISDIKIQWENDTAVIVFHDSLQKNTNYYFNFTDRIKGWHFNALDKNYVCVFRSGKLQENSIYGKISFEKTSDVKYPIFLNLLTEDSLFIFKKNYSNSNFKLNYLNNNKYVLRIFSDKNSNNYYDFIKEPFCEKKSELLKKQEINFKLAYADTSKPVIKQIKIPDSNHIEILFSEDVQLVKDIEIETDDSLKIKKKIIRIWEKNDQIKLLCEDLDTLNYALKIASVSDMKNNLNTTLFKVFHGVTLNDTIPPRIINSFPKNGEVINTLQPIIKISFSEIILDKDLHLKLCSNENKKYIDVKLIESDGFNFKMMPKTILHNYMSYRVVISNNTKDFKCNYIEGVKTINFIPIKKL
jgi:PBP1b-binding outer membrane lipoprotein LpoB